MKDIYIENYKNWYKKLKETQMERYAMLADWKNIVKMFILSKVKSTDSI